jgi:hypothetical protein
MYPFVVEPGSDGMQISAKGHNSPRAQCFAFRDLCRGPENDFQDDRSHSIERYFYGEARLAFRVIFTSAWLPLHRISEGGFSELRNTCIVGQTVRALRLADQRSFPINYAKVRLLNRNRTQYLACGPSSKCRHVMHRTSTLRASRKALLGFDRDADADSLDSVGETPCFCLVRLSSR